MSPERWKQNIFFKNFWRHHRILWWNSFMRSAIVIAWQHWSAITIFLSHCPASCILTSSIAPALSSAWKMSKFPLDAASIRGVRPKQSVQLTLAPLLNSKFTVSKWPKRNIYQTCCSLCTINIWPTSITQFLKHILTVNLKGEMIKEVLKQKNVNPFHPLISVHQIVCRWTSKKYMIMASAWSSLK